jgi:hypothetical protein
MADNSRLYFFKCAVSVDLYAVTADAKGRPLPTAGDICWQAIGGTRVQPKGGACRYRPLRMSLVYLRRADRYLLGRRGTLLRGLGHELKGRSH